MDTATAVANITPGSEVAALARCFDTLLQADFADTSILEKLLPFLEKNLLERNIIDYSIEPGIDITKNYFVLWEPFLRAKTALLIGTIIEKCKEVPDVSKLVNPLVDLFLSEEQIEQCFALIALSNIGLRKPEAILPLFPKLVKPLIQIVGAASSPATSFDLYHSKAFQSQVFESFFDFMDIPGLLVTPDNVQRLFENNITLAIIQVALSEQVYIEKKPATLWRMIWLFLRITTEHPQGLKMWDVDHIPKIGPQACQLMRLALVAPDRAAYIRNQVAKVPKEQWTAEKFTQLLKELPRQ
ncbi:hypothetical protein TVAG_286480 [Trichomonas vaginalis G3]|uniref:Uncharacterized protein n=1 Tax=Trichomonas vaginalis (strain ATCC PRA-98 / G3) TaxID=412133 RepID=A2EPG2_TRIV3|nr:armadillo (ARM) repeat-containing protein family [Trichomonas vaginalis G3]EAY05470.1 hypothetical protein TVAG_286480 [Trichomonas vaginalis G3]KAI5503552.1 armadillo (ARM) repeat-containing protein family [Trichomonas vaginalis G3]|eukprot:XP_001317693.1 hypothetical protein [Trichomonas vaginalis G3]